MTAHLGPEQAARLHEAEREWLVSSRARLRRAVVRRRVPAAASNRKAGAR